jgi:hypothetical protein
VKNSHYKNIFMPGLPKGEAFVGVERRISVLLHLN